MSTRIFTSLEDYRSAVGSELGVSGWLTVDQERVELFADATGDHQWIHVDQARAATTPWGGTVAHGFLTLSLGPRLLEDIYVVEGVASVVNYGLNHVRFPAALPVGARVRAHAKLVEVADHPAGMRSTTAVIIEADGVGRPVCVADFVAVLMPGPADS